MQNYQNKLSSFDLLVRALERLPSIGKKSARKMAYAMAVEETQLGMQILEALRGCMQELKKCSLCGGLSQGNICHICTDSSRNTGLLCIVSHPKDVFLIEELGEFSGRYCVIEDHREYDFESLIGRVAREGIGDIIFALSPSTQNDLAMLSIQDRLGGLGLSFSRIAQGVPSNVSLDNIDHFSLARAFSARVSL